MKYDAGKMLSEPPPAPAPPEISPPPPGPPPVPYQHPTICKRKECLTCQRVLENKGYVDLQCGRVVKVDLALTPF